MWPKLDIFLDYFGAVSISLLKKYFVYFGSYIVNVASQKKNVLTSELIYLAI